MGKNILIAVCVLLLAVFAAQAQVRFTLGMSGFLANYKLQDENKDDLLTASSTLLYGPYLSFTAGRFNMSTSVFFGSFPIDKINGIKVEANEEADLKRRDVNLSFGLVAVKGNVFTMTPFVGFKYFSWDFSGAYQDPDEWYFPDDPSIFYNKKIDENLTRTGFMGGAGVQFTLSVPPRSGFYFYSSLGLLGGTIDSEYKQDRVYQRISNPNIVHTFEDDPIKTSATTILFPLSIGIGYRIPRTGLGFNIGYRGDFFGSSKIGTEANADQTKTYSESMTGWVSSISWSF